METANHEQTLDNFTGHDILFKADLGNEEILVSICFYASLCGLTCRSFLMLSVIHREALDRIGNRVCHRLGKTSIEQAVSLAASHCLPNVWQRRVCANRAFQLAPSLEIVTCGSQPHRTDSCVVLLPTRLSEEPQHTIRLSSWERQPFTDYLEQSCPIYGTSTGRLKLRSATGSAKPEQAEAIL